MSNAISYHPKDLNYSYTVFVIKHSCAHSECRGAQNGAPGEFSLCSVQYSVQKYSEMRCTHRVHMYQHVCTRQPNYARQVQSAPSISKCHTMNKYRFQMLLRQNKGFKCSTPIPAAYRLTWWRYYWPCSWYSWYSCWVRPVARGPSDPAAA